jgi:RecA-family ATPase
MLHDGEINYTKGKSRDKDDEEEQENALKFPLIILDTANDIFVGQYNSKRKTQHAINRYQLKRRTKKISVIHHAADCRSDFTDRFRNTG